MTPMFHKKLKTLFSVNFFRKKYVVNHVFFSRLVFQKACLSYFSSAFPYFFYHLMRPLSKVEMCCGGSFPFFDFVSSLLLGLRYFLSPLLFFDFLNVPCLLLLSLCSYFCNMIIFYVSLPGIER